MGRGKEVGGPYFGGYAYTILVVGLIRATLSARGERASLGRDGRGSAGIRGGGPEGTLGDRGAGRTVVGELEAVRSHSIEQAATLDPSNSIVPISVVHASSLAPSCRGEAAVRAFGDGRDILRRIVPMSVLG